MGRHRVAPIEGLPRFYGGLVGYFSYDTVRYVEKRLAHSAPPDLLGTPERFRCLLDDHHYVVVIVRVPQLRRLSGEKWPFRQVFQPLTGAIRLFVTNLAIKNAAGRKRSFRPSQSSETD